MAEAYSKAQAVMGEGDAVAAGIYAKAYGGRSLVLQLLQSLKAIAVLSGKPGRCAGG